MLNFLIIIIALKLFSLLREKNLITKNQFEIIKRVIFLLTIINLFLTEVEKI